MGACDFECKTSAKSAKEAFRSLVEDALYESGHGGYSGTIAEKSSFRMVSPRSGESVVDCVRRCMEDLNHWSADKWGPAACVDGGPDLKQPDYRIFHFFGLASS